MTTDRLALNIDIAPTIVAAAGMPVPAVMQGRDQPALPGGSRDGMARRVFLRASDD